MTALLPQCRFDLLRRTRPMVLRLKQMRWYFKILAVFGFLISLHLWYAFSLIVFFPPITLTQLASVLDGNGLHREYVPLKKISAHAALAVIAAEDQLFSEHYGFDIESIENAIAYNKKHATKRRGASTISQQVAKNVFLWQGRSWLRKGLELYFSLLIETLWSKKRILEMYLNVAEMGRGVFGVEAASKKYFGKPASLLTREEAAKIAACLPNPKRYKVVPLSGYVEARLPWILQQMENLRYDEDVRELLSKAYNPKH